MAQFFYYLAVYADQSIFDKAISLSPGANPCIGYIFIQSDFLIPAVTFNPFFKFFEIVGWLLFVRTFVQQPLTGKEFFRCSFIICRFFPYGFVPRLLISSTSFIDGLVLTGISLVRPFAAIFLKW